MGSRKMSLAEQFPHIQNIVDAHGLYTLMQGYLTWLRERNYSEQTIAGRELFLCGLIDWCEQRNLCRPSEITKPILERYQRYLSLYRKSGGEPLSFRSQYNRIVAIRTWFKWLARQDLILTNPASDLELPRLEKRLPKSILNEREAETILSVPDVHTELGLRDRAILETLYSTGIRRMELVNLKVQDIDCERGTLIVRQGKGKKDRMIPIGSRAVQWIEKYTSDVRPEFICGRDDGVLFLSRYGDAISTNNLTTLVGGYVEQSRIGKKGACHLFRHSMATLMLENGADIRFIQVMLGHVSLNTTEMYTQVSIKKLKEVHSLTHPAQHGRTRFVDSDDVEPTEDALFTLLDAEAIEESDTPDSRR